MQTFGSKAVGELTGVTPRQIQYWDEEGIIKPSVREPSGRGTVRLYSYLDLIQFRVLKELKDQGVSLQKIRRSLDFLRRHAPEVTKPLARLRLVTDGETIFVLSAKDREILDALKGQFVFSLAIADLVKDLQGRVLAYARPIKRKVRVKGREFEVVLMPELEVGGYSVSCPALKGCRSQGETIEEALSMIEDAIGMWLAASERHRKGERTAA